MVTVFCLGQIEEESAYLKTAMMHIYLIITMAHYILHNFLAEKGERPRQYQD